MRLAQAVLAITLAFAFFAPQAYARHASTPSAQFAQFGTETAAQAHCPKDVVVWLNTKTGIYHERGMRWFGRTHQGAYVCRAEADAADDRDTRNGQ